MSHTGAAPVEYLAVDAPGAGPYALVSGPDGALWVTLVHAGAIARVGLDGSVEQLSTARLAHVDSRGAIEHVGLPAGSEPHGLTRGSDGALWVALEDGRLARVIDPRTA